MGGPAWKLVVNLIFSYQVYLNSKKGLTITSLSKQLSRVIRSPWFRWGFFLLCFTGVLYGNLRPAPPEQVFAHSDKAGHGLSFVFLAVSARLAMFRVPWFWLWPSLVGFSFIIEYLQGALRPLRTFSLEDAYANVLGVMIAIVIMVLWRYIAPGMLPDSAKLVGRNK